MQRFADAEEKGRCAMEQKSEISVNALAHTAKYLRSTLQQMYSALDTLDGCLPEENRTAEESFSSLLQGVFRVERLADNLSCMQQLESGEPPHPEHMDLAQELRSMLEKAEGLLRMAEIRLDWSLPRGAFNGSMDKKLLSLVFWNLLSNAAANANCGTVSVRVERIRLTRLRLTVTDSGDGIPAAQQEDVMQRCAVAPDDALLQTGAGFGLRLVQKTAQLFGGGMALLTGAEGQTAVSVELRTDLPAQTELHSTAVRFERSLDEGLVGLSDVLPRTVFDRRDILG